MAFQCDLCGKKPITGGRERRTGTRGFLKKRVKRVFRPNLRRVTVTVNGEKEKMRICTKCLKRIKKDEQAKQAKTKELKYKEKGKQGLTGLSTHSRIPPKR
ncbi:hypothetical protein KJ596_00220 [Patescibacteria group bacterium]|nr:hypothetical protein [Patescibacteria group bacterium]MBU1867979.1 hypothetical protein [Patescibacteria group bacterium]